MPALSVYCSGDTLSVSRFSSTNFKGREIGSCLCDVVRLRMRSNKRQTFRRTTKRFTKFRVRGMLFASHLMQALRHIWKHASAIALLCLFISGTLATPVSLVLPEPVTCGMECCEDSGECCCFISRQMQAHLEGDAGDEPQLAAASKGCESNCATPPSSSNLSLAQKAIPTIVCLTLIGKDEGLAHQTAHLRSLILCRRSAPRAPPACA